MNHQDHLISRRQTRPSKARTNRRGSVPLVVLVSRSGRLIKQLRALLESGGLCAIDAIDGVCALDLIMLSDCICLITSLDNIDLSGTEVLKRCKQLKPRMPVFVIFERPPDKDEIGLTHAADGVFDYSLIEGSLLGAMRSKFQGIARP